MIPHEHIRCERCQGTGYRERVAGLAIREMREDAGMSLAYVAEKLGIGVPYLSEMERGKRTMTEKMAERIVAICEQRRW